MRSFPQTFNTIFHAEQRHQVHSAPRRRWRVWISRLLTAVVLLSAGFYLIRSFASIALSRRVVAVYTSDPYFDWENYLLVLSVAWVVILHFRLMFQTLGLSANTISRERQGGTWELLALTGVDAQHIVLGKWWAVVKRMARPYLVLGALRAMVILWVTIATFGPYLYYGYRYTRAAPGSDLHRLTGIFSIMFFILMLTVLNLAFTAACGLSASSGHSRGGIALARAVGTRLCIIFLAVFIPVMIAITLRFSLSSTGSFIDTLMVAGGFTLITLVDNGVLASIQVMSIYLSAPSYQYYLTEQYGMMQGITLGILAAAAAYTLLTWVMLRLATRSAVRQGALPPSGSTMPRLSGVAPN